MGLRRCVCDVQHEVVQCVSKVHMYEVYMMCVTVCRCVMVCMCVTVCMCRLVCTCAWLHKVWHLCEGEANYNELDTLATTAVTCHKDSINTSQYMCTGYPYNQAI